MSFISVPVLLSSSPLRAVEHQNSLLRARALRLLRRVLP